MEWLVYHRSIGFQHVYLYCNDDDPSELYDRLCGFLNEVEPFLTLVHYPFQGLQWEMYLHWFRHYGDEADWIAFLDADEFLALPGLDNIGRFIQRFPEDEPSNFIKVLLIISRSRELSLVWSTSSLRALRKLASSTKI